MENSGQQFETVDDARPRPREVSAGVDEINLPGARRWKRIEFRKTPEQFEISPRKFDVVAAEREHDNLRARIQYLLPIDLRRRLMLRPDGSCPPAISISSGPQLAKRRINPFHQKALWSIGDSCSAIAHIFHSRQ